MTRNDCGRNQNSRPSPSVIGLQLSFLSTQFHLLGRGGPYDDSTGRGNSCMSMSVGVYRHGYVRQAGMPGYQECSAVPLTDLKYQHLVEYLYGRICTEGGLSWVLLL